MMMTDDFSFGSIVFLFLVVLFYFTYVVHEKKNQSPEDVKNFLLSKTPRQLDQESLEWLKEHKVYISLTTSPLRINKIHDVLGTLDMTNVEKVFVTLPRKYGRTGETYNVPENFPGSVEIIWIDNDLGPISKMIPAIEKIKQIDPESCVISVDDDTGYPLSMVNELIHNYVKHKCVITTYRDYFTLREEDNFPALIAGFSGVLYPVKLIDTDILRKMSSSSKQCYISDDFVISYYLYKHKIKNRVIEENPYFNMCSLRQYSYGFLSDAIHVSDENHEFAIDAIGNMHYGKYNSCYKALTTE